MTASPSARQRGLVHWVSFLAVLMGCNDPSPALPPPPPIVAAAPSTSPTHSAAARLVAGTEADIPPGPLRVGSRPGSRGRNATFEADLVEVHVPAFRIDRLPYPNDPDRAPTTHISQLDANALCATRDKRLCTEIEWERACQGDAPRTFASGDSLDIEACSLNPLSCASPFDVIDLGLSSSEWTASRSNRGLGDETRTTVARGAVATAAHTDHRCAARHVADPSIGSPDITFRCCRGPQSDLAYPEEPERRRFRIERVPEERLRSIVQTVAELAEKTAEIHLFNDSEVDSVLERGGHDRAGLEAWRFVTDVIVWSPIHGEEAWVFAATSRGSSFIAVLHPLPDGTFVHGASFIFDAEPTSIALAYSPGQRDILWSTCWGCRGENGAVTLRDDGQIVIVQR